MRRACDILPSVAAVALAAAARVAASGVPAAVTSAAIPLRAGARASVFPAALAAAALFPPATAGAQGRAASSPAVPPGLSRVIPVDLDPVEAAAPTTQRTARTAPRPTGPLQWGRWRYKVERVDGREAVPWRLTATPLSDLAEWLQPAERFVPAERVDDVPVVRIPEVLWPLWFDKDLHDVVGIHYHEFLGAGKAQLLLTIHKVPADGPDGNPPADYRGRRGTRLEATLLTPLTYYLDQTFVVRVERLGAPPSEQVKSRERHEKGHGGIALESFVTALAGPQDWNLTACTGRRSTLKWYWRSQRIVRGWDGYRGATGRLPALRTGIVLVPPTRWSLLLPLGPEDLTQQMVQDFNDVVVHLTATYRTIDEAAQAKFHASHGEYESADGH